jgi:GT2 family glycosyltransferase
VFDLSVVIITHNNQRLLLDCLKSVYSSSPALSLQVVVVFNRCGDDSQAHVQKLFPQVLTIDNPHNEGFSRANNHGLKRATGEYVMLLNDDTLVYPLALTHLIDFCKNQPLAGAVGPKLLNPDGSLQVAGSKLAGSIYKTKSLEKYNTRILWKCGPLVIVKILHRYDFFVRYFTYLAQRMILIDLRFTTHIDTNMI